MSLPTRSFALTLFGVLCQSACGQDYDLNGNKDLGEGLDTGTDTDPGTDTDFSDVCEGLGGSPHDVSLNTECDVSLQTGTFTPVVEYHYGTSSFCGPPAVGQIVDSNRSGAIDADDMPAIVIYQGGASGTSGGKVVAVKGDNSGVFWESAAGMGQDGGFAIGDLNGDGFPEVVAAGPTKVTALDGQTGARMWQSAAIPSSLDPYGYNYPSIADMNGDGLPEVTAGNAILDGQTGATKGIGTLGKGAAPYSGDPSESRGTYGTLSVPVDLDGDGRMELVTGNAAYKIDGSTQWRNAGLDGLIAVADFDGDGEGEIVKTSGIYITGMESDGTEAWGPIQYGSTNPAQNTNVGAPAVDDLNGDGAPDIVFAASNQLVAMEWGGGVLWTATINDSSGAAGPVLFDFDRDGYPEVLYADETNVRFFSGLDGSVKLDSNQHASYTILETPVVADVDNDDQVEIVLGHCSWNKSFSVYGDADGSWPPGRKIWNQHGYSITNVGGLGEIPTGSIPNWPEYNSFRSGDVGQPPGEYLDVQAEIFDVCETECADGHVYVGAWVLNSGNLEAPAGIPVSIKAGPGGAIVATQYTTRAIPSGQTGEALIFEIARADLADEVPLALADEDATGNGIVYECDELNNTYDWSTAVCP